jgi:putative ABC transport system permease protein
LLRFFWELGRLPPGFDTRNLYALRTRLARAEVTPDDVSARAASLIDALAGVEGVEAVAIASRLPLGGEASLVVTPQAVRPEGPNRRQASGRPVAARTAVSPGFFATLGIPVVRGRGFSELDGTGSPRVAVVSAHLARAWWPGEDPLGKTVRLGGPSSPDAVTVVGVAGDVMSSHTLRSPYLYLPLAQDPQPTMYVLARLPRAVVDQAAVKRAIASVPPFALDEIMSVEDALAHRLDGGGFVMGLIGVFTVLSLLLATVGVYTVISHTTAQRTREIGVRVALGAGRLDVLRAVVGPMVALCAVGLGVGALGTVLVTRVTWSLLIDVSGTSPTVWAAVLGVLGVAAILACAAPVRLALSVDPAVVLRHN